LDDETPELLDVPEGNQPEFAVNCSCFNSSVNEQEN
jgi:hypothetical protein